MNLVQGVVGVLIILFLFANLLHPGGWIITTVIVIGLIVAYAALEFMPEYLLVTNQGKNARKDKRRQRRASGLNPFSRTSSSDEARQTQSQQSTGESSSSGSGSGGNDE